MLSITCCWFLCCYCSLVVIMMTLSAVSRLCLVHSGFDNTNILQFLATPEDIRSPRDFVVRSPPTKARSVSLVASSKTISRIPQLTLPTEQVPQKPAEQRETTVVLKPFSFGAKFSECEKKSVVDFTAENRIEIDISPKVWFF